MAKQSQHHGRAWYVLHTYSGYEDNVSRNLRQRIESMDMQDLIFDVMVPIEKKIKIKAGKRTVVEEKIYPGYVLVDSSKHAKCYGFYRTRNNTYAC